MFLHLCVILFTRGALHPGEGSASGGRPHHQSDTTGYGKQAGGTGMHSCPEREHINYVTSSITSLGDATLIEIPWDSSFDSTSM